MPSRGHARACVRVRACKCTGGRLFQTIFENGLRSHATSVSYGARLVSGPALNDSRRGLYESREIYHGAIKIAFSWILIDSAMQNFQADLPYFYCHIFNSGGLVIWIRAIDLYWIHEIVKWLI